MHCRPELTFLDRLVSSLYADNGEAGEFGYPINLHVSWDSSWRLTLMSAVDVKISIWPSAWIPDRQNKGSVLEETADMLVPFSSCAMKVTV